MRGVTNEHTVGLQGRMCRSSKEILVSEPIQANRGVFEKMTTVDQEGHA